MFRDPVFKDRTHAGRVLAEHVSRLVRKPGALVLALPRGGVPVAFEVARKLPEAELDLFLVRKLGVPGQEELAIGAVASGGTRILNEALIRELGFSHALIDEITAREEAELRIREESYRRGFPALPCQAREIILVDDGLATGASMKAATSALRLQAPERIIIAVPVGARDTCLELRTLADELVCLHAPAHFVAVGAMYQDFSQTSDEEVHRLLAESRSPCGTRTARSSAED